MKIHLLFTVLLIALLGCQSADPETEKANAETALREFYNALEKTDYETMKTFCTPEFNAIENGEEFENMDEFVAIIKSMEITSAQIKMNFVKTEVTGNLATSVVKFDAVFHTASVSYPLKSVENYILKKVNGKWLIDFFLSTHLNTNPTIEKGNLLGLHIFNTIELKPGVTQAQAEEFILNKYIPAFNELTDEIKAVPIRGLRGQNKGVLGIIFYFKSDEIRNQYWSAEGVYTDKGLQVFQQLQDLQVEGEKLYTLQGDVYTDWQVQ